jgi:hypothetical protein
MDKELKLKWSLLAKQSLTDIYYILIVDIFHNSRNPESLEDVKSTDGD